MVNCNILIIYLIMGCVSIGDKPQLTKTIPIVKEVSTESQKIVKYGKNIDANQQVISDKQEDHSTNIKRAVIRPYEREVTERPKLEPRVERKQAASSNIQNVKIRQIYQIEPRDKQIIIELPTASEGKYSKEDLIKWITEVAETVFSSTFHHYYRKEMTYEQAKIYCAQNIIKNIVYLQLNYPNLTGEQYKIIDIHLKKKSLNFINTKYPLTEQVEISKDLLRRLKEVDNMQDSHNNQIYKCKIQLSYHPSGIYNDFIMKFLNYLINRINSPLETLDGKMGLVKEQDDQQSIQSLNNLFQKQMTELFKKIQNEHWMTGHRVDQYNYQQIAVNQSAKITQHTYKSLIKRSLSKTDNKKNKISDQEFKKQQKYATAVKEYTHYVIGRKIQETVLPFTDEEIESESLEIKHPAILRILTKWCDQLEEKFKTPNYFQSRSANIPVQGLEETRNLTPKLRKALDTRMSKQYELIRKEFDKNLQHDYDLEFKLLQNQKETAVDDRYLKKIDQMAGKFTVNMVDNLHNQMILKLNRLIHGLMNVSKGLFQDDFSKNQIVDWPNPPNLVTFSVSDLLRCKISSKEKQILALYKYLVDTSNQKSSNIKIIRIKNRLKRNTNDVLINIRFHNVIVCEIQLAIKSKASDFLICSNTFQHFIYELIRSQFGPFTELCSVRRSLDKRCDIYEKMTHSKRNEHVCTQGSKLDNFGDHSQPFICDRCNHIIYNSNYLVSHQKCLDCGFHLCARCHLTDWDLNLIKSHILDQRDFYKDFCLNRIKSLNDIKADKKGQKYYVSLAIESKSVQPKFFKIIFYKYAYNLISRKQQKYYQILCFTQSQKKAFQDYLSKNIVIALKKSKYSDDEGSNEYKMNMIQDQLKIDKIQKGYLIINNIKKVYKLEKETIDLQTLKINNEQCQNILNCGTYDQMKKVKNLMLGFNKLENIPFSHQCFPQLRYVDLSKNKINNIDKLRQFATLERLNLKEITFPSFPQVLFDLSQLSILNISDSNIQTIPKQIQKMVNLTLLQISDCHLSQIPTEIRFCSKLKQIYFQKNNIRQIPAQMGELIELRDLFLFSNEILSLPQQIGQLTKLQQLRLHQNLLSVLPSSFGYLSSLKNLNISRCQIQSMQKIYPIETLNSLICQRSNITQFKMDDHFKKLTQLFLQSFKQVCLNFEEKSLLKVLQIRYCEHLLIYNIPMKSNLRTVNLCYLQKFQFPQQLFSRLQTLKQLTLVDVKLKQIPSLVRCYSLQKLILHSNQIADIPTLSHLKQLNILDLAYNKIPSFSQNLFRMSKLTTISFQNNQIKAIIPSSNNIKTPFSIINLNIEENLFQQFPSSLIKCVKLQKLNIASNPFPSVPPEMQLMQGLKSVVTTLDKSLFPLSVQNKIQSSEMIVPTPTVLTKCYNCCNSINYPCYWLPFESQPNLFGCIDCIEAESDLPDHHYQYQNNSILLLQEYKEKIDGYILGENLQPWDEETEPTPNSFICSKCRENDRMLGYPRFICVSCGSGPNGYQDLCIYCMSELIEITSGKIKDQQFVKQILSWRDGEHKSNHLWLRVLYRSREGYYTF